MTTNTILSARQRDWLNPIESDDTGSVASVVNLEKHFYTNDEGEPVVDHQFYSGLTLRDCSRQVHIDFGVDNFSDVDIELLIKQRLHKARVIITHMEQIIFGLEAYRQHLKDS